MIDPIRSFIGHGKPVPLDDVPEALRDTQYVEERLIEPSECPTCGDGVIIVDETDDAYEVRCHSNHFRTVAKSERIRYVPSFDRLLRDIAAELDIEVTSINDDNLPRYVIGKTSRAFTLYLVYAPRHYEDTIKEIYEDAIELGQPSILITPRNTISEIVELQFLFSVGHLVQAVPFQKIGESELLTDYLDTAEQIERLDEDVMAKRFGDDIDELRKRVKANPKYILSILSNIRMLRENGEIGPGSGELLENTAEAVFMHLFPTQPARGGEADSGENLPDNVFYIWEEGNYDFIDFEPILGLVDTKSGKDANFAKEPVSGKHDDYVKSARKLSFKHGSVAHIFVVLDIDGQQEIKFHDRMKPSYEENMYLIVLTLDALVTIFAAYLSSVVSNELKLNMANFSRAVYPLFHRDTFNSEEFQHLRRIFREVGQEPEVYQMKLLERPDLMVINDKVVMEHLRTLIEGPAEVEEILSQYFQ
ncbi:hypothetical protein [Halomarina pelagica]|uniref:hypothetical protein n=1 Tax=Halomarina pelagica TaxID=2961599 RepID=UPI0020C38E5F|nr:hypothetical protein [Halomarina sp. BND7]